jgi:hypothetical protein
VRVKGKFVAIEAGNELCQNTVVISHWYYLLEVSELSEVHVCLHQEDLLIKNQGEHKKYKHLAVIIFEKGNKWKPSPIQLRKYAPTREYRLKMILDRGTYIIIPIINEEISNKKTTKES